MGSKSSSAPSPDPRLVEAQIRSMGVQDDMIRRIVDSSESMMPLQREQAQFALDTGRRAVADAAADREWMLTRRGMLSGTQDRLVNQANEFDARVRTDELAGQANADAQAAISSARASSGRELARRGIMPGSGRAAGTDARLALGGAAMLAGAQNNARTAARQENYALTDRAANALAGYPAMSSAASNQGAGIAANGVNVVNAGAAGMNAGYGAAAGIAGQMGSNATGMWNAQANYNANVGNQSAQGFGALLGGGATIAAAFI
jgi:hypothetical protein